MTEECGSCRFWILRTDHAAELGGGYCRRYPPFFPSGMKVWHHPEQHKPLDMTLSRKVVDAWPNTHQQSWCGEFSPSNTNTK